MKTRTIIEILSYPLVGLIFIISWLPLWLLHRFSYLIFVLLYYVIGYRKQVAYNNLARSFPEKSTRELLKIRRKFYRHLSALIVESVKQNSFSVAKFKQHCRFTPDAAGLINSYLQKNKSIFLVMGHYGNWEWTGSSVFSNFGINSVAAYKPVKNRVFDRLMKRLRTRFGAQVCHMKEIPKHIFAVRKKTTAFVLAADQTPSKSNAHWVNFLNQDTPVFTGTARLSKMFNYPLIFCLPRPVKMGYYEVHAKLITANPKEHDEETITRMHTQILEEEIKRAPEYWLWTHRRWKHKRPE